MLDKCLDLCYPHHPPCSWWCVEIMGDTLEQHRWMIVSPMVKEQGWMCGFMNGACSDDAVSIQKMVTPNMGCLESGYSEHGLLGTWLLRTWLHVTWFLRTWLIGIWILLNMVTTKLLGTLLHQYRCVPTLVITTTPNMVAWNLVTPNMVDRNLDSLEHGYYEVTWNLVTPIWLCSTLVIATTPNMVAWNLVTPMVDRNLDTLEHGYYELSRNLVTPTWLCSTLVIAHV